MEASHWFINWKKHVFWILIFLFLCVLSIDIWNWGYSEPLLFGLPWWVVYHIILTVSLSFFFWLFVKDQWRAEDD